MRCNLPKNKSQKDAGPDSPQETDEIQADEFMGGTARHLSATLRTFSLYLFALAPAQTGSSVVRLISDKAMLD